MWVKGACCTWLCDRLLSFEFLFVDPGRLLEGSCLLKTPRTLWALSACDHWRREEKGTTEDEMVGWHHRFDADEFQWTPGVSDGQGGLACSSLWGHEWGLNWTQLLELLLQKWPHGGSTALLQPPLVNFFLCAFLVLFRSRVDIGYCVCFTCTGAWFSDTPTFINSFLGSFSQDRGLQCLQ